DLTAVVVPQEAEIAEVPVLVVDQRIEHQHTAKLLGERLSQFIVIVKAGGDSAAFDQPPNGDVRGVYIGEQRAFGRGDSLPVFQIIMHGVQMHDFCNL